MLTSVLDLHPKKLFDSLLNENARLATHVHSNIHERCPKNEDEKNTNVKISGDIRRGRRFKAFAKMCSKMTLHKGDN